jgi:histidine ammonia-lyase
MNAPRPLTPDHLMPPIIVGDAPLTIEDVNAVARGQRAVILGDDAGFRSRVTAGAAFLDRLLEQGGDIYGVNTGYGDSCDVRIPPELLAELPLHLTRYHGCGLGRHLDEDATLAVLLARVSSLAQGYSGVRWTLLESLVGLINQRILPLIPEEGSVGASGDLTPLSYVAAVLVGEREVRYRGEVQAAGVALAAAGMSPLELKPKEGLALMNGTAVMTALACLAYARAEYLTRLCSRVTALAVVALRGNRGHFDPRLFAVKPHAGQNACAAWIFEDLTHGGNEDEAPMRLQDRYSIRCAPHVIGVLRDALTWMRRDIETELNSANDNPIVDGENEQLFHGGHFYGGHIAFAMDGMKNAVANLADLMDRQLALLVDARYNHGLPQNLSGAEGPRAAINHGLKAVQIGASAWTAEALKLTMPASVFSRSTECHNQDKVSMGTIAARDCLRVLELTEQVIAAQLLACRQALEIRERRGERALEQLSPDALRFFEAVRADTLFIDEDRPLESTLRDLVAAAREQRWTLYP